MMEDYLLTCARGVGRTRRRCFGGAFGLGAGSANIVGPKRVHSYWIAMQHCYTFDGDGDGVRMAFDINAHNTCACNTRRARILFIDVYCVQLCELNIANFVYEAIAIGVASTTTTTTASSVRMIYDFNLFFFGNTGSA